AARDPAAAPFVFGKAPAKVADAQERRRGAVVGIGTLRINREHLVIDRDRLREPCQVLQRGTLAQKGLDMTWIGGEQRFIDRKRLVVPLARHQRKGNVVERVLVVRTLSEYMLEVREGLRKAIELQERDSPGPASKMMIRRERQRAVEGFDRFLAVIERVEREPA